MKSYSWEGKNNLIGERLKEMRIKKGLTQQDLASKLELRNIFSSQKKISRIEAGDRFVSDFELLAFSEILGVDVMWLLTGKESNRN